MGAVVADTSSIRYLTEIDHLEVLPRLFEAVLIPNAVYDELQQLATPARIRQLLNSPPSWLKIESTLTLPEDPFFAGLDQGERAALALGLHLRADRKAGVAARLKGLQTTGTLGVLARAADSNLINLPDAFERLRQTSFYCPQGLMDSLLNKHKGGS